MDSGNPRAAYWIQTPPTPEALSDIVQVLLDYAPALTSDLREAAKRRDSIRLRWVTHALERDLVRVQDLLGTLLEQIRPEVHSEISSVARRRMQ